LIAAINGPDGLVDATDLLITGRMIGELGGERHRLLHQRRRLTLGSVATIKRHLESSFDQAFTESERLMSESFTGDDVKEAVAAYRERRPPRFVPRPPRWRQENR
jgi:enoyl-CoA hydratase/carnithine racemase